MRVRWVSVLLLVSVAGCSWLTGSQTFSVYFQPYSAELDQQARETIGSAASFAKSHPLRLVGLNGFSAPPDPARDVAGLSAQRAEMVKQVLISDGVRPDRITIVANGITDPKVLPSLAVRRVDINVGQ